MKNLWLIFLILPLSLCAETITSVMVDGDYVLVRPTNFFTVNSNALNRAVSASAGATGKLDATNGLAVTLTTTNATLKGTTAVPSGGGVNLEAGSAMSVANGAYIFVRNLFLTGDPFASGDTEPASVGYVKFKSEALVDDLASLKALQVNNSVQRRAYVKAATGSDNANGPWYWDPASTATVTAVCVASDYVSPGSAGRWFKL